MNIFIITLLIFELQTTQFIPNNSNKNSKNDDKKSSKKIKDKKNIDTEIDFKNVLIKYNDFLHSLLHVTDRFYIFERLVRKDENLFIDYESGYNATIRKYKSIKNLLKKEKCINPPNFNIKENVKIHNNLQNKKKSYDDLLGKNTKILKNLLKYFINDFNEINDAIKTHKINKDFVLNKIYDYKSIKNLIYNNKADLLNEFDETKFFAKKILFTFILLLETKKCAVTILAGLLLFTKATDFNIKNELLKTANKIFDKSDENELMGFFNYIYGSHQQSEYLKYLNSYKNYDILNRILLADLKIEPSQKLINSFSKKNIDNMIENLNKLHFDKLDVIAKEILNLTNNIDPIIIQNIPRFKENVER